MDEAPVPALLRDLLQRRVKFVITDGRVIIGRFKCTDRDCNIIVGDSEEYGPDPAETGVPGAATHFRRKTGLCLIPGSHILSAAVCAEDIESAKSV